MLGVKLNGLGSGCSSSFTISLFSYDTSCSITTYYHTQYIFIVSLLAYSVLFFPLFYGNVRYYLGTSYNRGLQSMKLHLTLNLQATMLTVKPQ